MRKFARIPLALFSVGMLLVGGMALAAVQGGGKVSVKLAPVPKVKTAAKGTAAFTLDKDGDSLHFKLNVDGIENVTMGHIHAVGDDGTPAAIITWLYPSKGEAPSLRAGKTKGTLSEGDITADRLSGPLKGKTVKDLYEMLETGKAGVAIHTEKNPGGELWAFHKGMTGHKGMMEHKGMTEHKKM